MKHTIKLLTLAAILTAVFGLTGCPGPVNNYIEPEYVITVNVTNGTAEYPTTAKAGDSVTITATANEGFVFDGASSAFDIPSCDLSSDRKVITWNLVMPASDVTINVVFKTVEDNTTVDDGNSDGEDENPTDEGNDDTESGDEPEQTPEDNDPVDEGDDSDNNDVENGGDEETTQWTYVAGGCDDPNCPNELRYQYNGENDYQISAYVYSSKEDAQNSENERVLYFSFPHDTAGISQIVIGNNDPKITIDNLIQMKNGYVGKTVKYFAYESNDFTTQIDDFEYENWSEKLEDLDSGSPIYIVIK